MTKSSPITDASMKAPSPTSLALQTTERETRAPAATCVRGPRLVGPTMTALAPTETPSPRMTGPTRRAVEWTFAVACEARSPVTAKGPQRSKIAGCVGIRSIVQWFTARYVSAFRTRGQNWGA